MNTSLPLQPVVLEILFSRQVVDALKRGQWFVNIPFAAYGVTATLVEANGTQKKTKVEFYFKQQYTQRLSRSSLPAKS